MNSASVQLGAGKMDMVYTGTIEGPVLLYLEYYSTPVRMAGRVRTCVCSKRHVYNTKLRGAAVAAVLAPVPLCLVSLHGGETKHAYKAVIWSGCGSI